MFANAVFLSEFDIDKGSVLRHRVPAQALEEVGDDSFANAMLPEGCHARSSDETITVLRRGQREPLYLLTLVSTRRDTSVRRGAAVKALGVATPHPHLVSSLRAPLIIALNLLEGEVAQAMMRAASEEENEGGVSSSSSASEHQKSAAAEGLLRDLLVALNDVDLSAMPLPKSETDRMLMWRGVSDNNQATHLAPQHCPEMWTYSTEFRLREIATNLVLPLYLKQNLEKQGQVSASPTTALSSGDGGGGSCSSGGSGGDEVETIDVPLCSTLVLALGPFQTMKLFNAVIAGHRILIVGQTAAQEVGQLVLAAVALVSPPLPGLLAHRAFPYVSLTDLNFLKTPGFIAGATNPVFASNAKWWDVLVQIHEPEAPSSPASPSSSSSSFSSSGSGSRHRTITVTTSAERAKEDEKKGRRSASSSSSSSLASPSRRSPTTTNSIPTINIVEGYDCGGGGSTSSSNNGGSDNNGSGSSGGVVGSVVGSVGSVVGVGGGRSSNNHLRPPEAQRKFDAAFGARIESGLKTRGLGEDWVRSEFRWLTSVCVNLARDNTAATATASAATHDTAPQQQQQQHNRKSNKSSGGGGGGDGGDGGGKGGGGGDSSSAGLCATKMAGGGAWTAHVSAHQGRAQAIAKNFFFALKQQQKHRLNGGGDAGGDSGDGDSDYGDDGGGGGDCGGGNEGGESTGGVSGDEGGGVGCLIEEEEEDTDNTAGGSIPAELLRVLRRLSDGAAELIEPLGVTSLFEALDAVNWNEASLKRLVNVFPERSGGGVGNSLLGPALFHRDQTVQRVARSLFELISTFDSTSPALASLSPLLRSEVEKQQQRRRPGP